MLKIKLYKKKAALFRNVEIGLFAFIFLLSACKPHVITPETTSAPFNIKKLLVLPFKDMSKVYGENITVRCPLCGTIFVTGNVAEGAGDILTEHLITLLKSNTDFNLIPSGQAQGVLSGDENRLSELELLVETGRALKADAVMVGHIYRFRERIGTRYSVDSPASVAFDIHLISVKNGRILWVDHLDETQRSLSENLFQLGTFLRRKGTWITAEEMAISGLEDMLLNRYKP